MHVLSAAAEVAPAIPHYSLQQSSGMGSTMIEVLRADGTESERHVNFLIPHRKDYYLMVLVKKGCGRHWIDFTPYNLQADTFYFTIPQQVHIKEESKPLTGYLLCFTSEFLQLEDAALKNFPIIKNEHNGHQLNLQPQDVAFINDTMQKMHAEFEAGNGWHNQMLQAYLRLLLTYTSRLYIAQYANETQAPDRVLLKKFQRLIEDNYRTLHHVAAYADMLSITPGHLNDVVKQQGGKTAITHIHERLMVEAKRILMHTDLSVKQIAAQLGFEDAAYFNRFFKRNANDTPLSYRTKIREMYS